MRDRLLRSLLTVLSAVPALAACGGGDTGNRTLVIVQPVAQPGEVLSLCLGQDESDTLTGVQKTVRVSAEGFKDGDLVRISFDGAQPDPQLVQSVVGEAVVFSNLTFPEGTHSIAARSDDGDIQSNIIQFDVDTEAPEVSFVNPTDGRTLRVTDDTDQTTVGIDFDVEVFANVADGDLVSLVLTDPDGMQVTPAPVMAVGDHATIPAYFNKSGSWQIRAESATACGNEGSATIDVTVILSADVPCDLRILPDPIDVGAPTLVLNAALDPDPGLPLFQATLRVDTDPGNTTEIYVDLVPSGSPRTADASGIATFMQGLAEKVQTIKARCVAPGGLENFSGDQTVLVDVTAPTCNIGTPASGSTLTPADDVDPSDADIDFDIDMSVGGTDTDGQPADFTVDFALYSTTVAGGSAQVIASVNSPGSYTITGTTQDVAANPCSDSIPISVDTAGCAITWSSPTGIVSTDAAPGTPGVQIAVSADVSSDCGGRTVTLSNCDDGGPLTATASATGAVSFSPVDFCASDLCDTVKLCTVSVTDGSGITTDLDVSVHVDTQPPSVTMVVSNPSVSCGSTITPADDVDAATPGVQVTVRLFTFGSPRWFEVTGPAGPPPTVVPADAGGFADVTMVNGSNSIVALAQDTSGLTGSSPPCALTLANLAVSIDSPLDGALLGAADGTVSGSDLLVDVCGTVGEAATATVNLLRDGAPVGTVSPDGAGNWCVLDVPMASGMHTLTANGSSTTGNMGSASIDVTVDITPPSPPTGFTVTALRRNAADVGWNAASDGGLPAAFCTVKASRSPVTEGNFAAATTVATVTGVSPGLPQSAVADLLELGAWHFAIKCFDNAGNGSTIVVAGPVSLDFTRGGALTPAVVLNYDTLGDPWMGYAIAGADLDDDGFSDVIVGAPNAEKLPVEGGDPSGEGLVYIYMGASGGISSGTPDFVIRGNDPGGQAWLGSSIARVDWNGDGVDDIAIGAPLGNNYGGEVRIFYGDAFAWSPGTLTTYLDDTDADVLIRPGTTDTWFNFGFLGWRIDTVNFDGDSRDDLLIGVPGGDGLRGGAILLFGGSSAAAINIPDNLVTSGITAYRFTFTSGTNALSQYGTHLAGLGILGNAPGTDTREDVAIAPEADFVAGTDPVVSEERFFVFYGRAQPASGMVSINNDAAEEQVIGEVESDGHLWFGDQMGSIQDQGGDGRRDLVVTAFAAGDTHFGKIYVVAGGTGTAGGAQVTTDLRTATPQTELTGSQVNWALGVSVANPAAQNGGADIDNDGVEDLVATSRYDASNRGAIYMWHGGSIPATGDQTTAQGHYAGPSVFVWSTTSAWVGDVNGDGLNDVAWGDAMWQNSAVINQTGAFEVLY